MRVDLTPELEHPSVSPTQDIHERTPDAHGDRNHHEGRERQLPRNQQHERERTEEFEDGAHQARDLARHQHPELLDLGSQPTHNLTRACSAEEREVQVEQMVVDLVAQIPVHSLLRAREQIHAGEREEVLDEEDREDEDDDASDRNQGITGQVDPGVDCRVEESLDSVVARCQRGATAHEERVHERDQQYVGRRIEHRIDRCRRNCDQYGGGVGSDEPDKARVQRHAQCPYRRGLRLATGTIISSGLMPPWRKELRYRAWYSRSFVGYTKK